jgi:hypothetical protein
MKFLQWACLLVCAGSLAAPAGSVGLDYPLALKTRWTYHLHHVLGEGVRFGPDDAKLAKGKVLDTTLVTEVMGVDTFGGRTYTRVENRRSGKRWLVEWLRLTPEGLMVGKTAEYDQEATTTMMKPEQRRIAAELRGGYFWNWQPPNVPVRIQYDIVGPMVAQVPAGRFDAIQIRQHSTLGSGASAVHVRQLSWFVPGVGIVKQETETDRQGRMLAHVELTLEKVEKPAIEDAQPAQRAVAR